MCSAPAVFVPQALSLSYSLSAASGEPKRLSQNAPKTLLSRRSLAALLSPVATLGAARYCLRTACTGAAVDGVSLVVTLPSSFLSDGNTMTDRK
eukprot:1882056-Rhodomonas_salina.1